MFSRTCEYALRALIFIAQQTIDGRRVGIKEIAEGIDSPEYFIAKILQNLSKKDFVQSLKGPNGGFFSSDENLTLTIADVVKEIDGDKLFSRCGLGLDFCSSAHPCPIHEQFQHIKTAMKTMMEGSSVRMLAENLEVRKTFLKY